MALIRGGQCKKSPDSTGERFPKDQAKRGKREFSLRCDFFEGGVMKRG
jgi:hypothetical protein